MKINHKKSSTGSNQSKATFPRLSILHRLLRKTGCNYFFITDPIDIEYICGFHASSITLLVGKKGNLIFTDFRYKEAAEAFCRKHKEFQFIQIHDGSYSYLRPHVPQSSCLGIQSNIVSLDQFSLLKKAVRKVSFMKIGSRISDLSLQKTSEEVKAMGRAARIGDRAFRKIVSYIQPGITELELSIKLDGLCREMGSEKPSFDSIVLFGSRTALPHGTPSRKKLKEGDFVLFDFGCTYHGLCSDMTRTVVAGRATSRQRDIYNTVLNAQSQARKNARIGMTAAEVDAMTRNPINEAGYGEAFGHATGHGVGRRVHEKPRISYKNNDILQEGMVVTIEPGIYVPNFGGVRIEDMIVFEKDTTTPLTHSPRKLLEIGI